MQSSQIKKVFLTYNVYCTFPFTLLKCCYQTAIYSNSTMEVVEEVRVARDVRTRVCKQDNHGPDFSPPVSVLRVIVTLVGREVDDHRAKVWVSFCSALGCISLLLYSCGYISRWALKAHGAEVNLKAGGAEGWMGVFPELHATCM